MREEFLVSLIVELSQKAVANVKEKMKRLKEDTQKETQFEVKADDKPLDKLKEKFKSVGEAIKSIKGGLASFGKGLLGAVKGIAEIGLLGLLMLVAKAWGFINDSITFYKNQSEEVKKKYEEIDKLMAGLKYAVGSVFAPIINFVLDGLIKILNFLVRIVAYVNIFLKALGFAGINMSNFAKDMGASAKGAKALNKQLSGFDELNNLTENSGGGGGGGADIPNPFDNIELDEGKIAKIQAFASWLKENLLPVLALIAGAFSAIKVHSMGIPWDKAIGIGIAVAGIVIAIGKLIDYLKDPTWENFGQMIGGIGMAIAGVGIALSSTPLMVAGVAVIIMGILMSFWDQITQGFNLVYTTFTDIINQVHNVLTTKFGIFGALFGTLIEVILEIFKNFIKLGFDLLDSIFKGIRQVVDGIIQMCKGDLKGGIETVVNGLKTFIFGILKAIWNFISTTFTNIINRVGDTITKIGNKISTGVRDILNRYIINPINRLIGWVNEKLHFSYDGLNIAGKQIIEPFNVQLVRLGTIPSLDVGTGYVPNDMLAQIHQGEAIIPKKFNDQEFFGNNSDEETHELLERLIAVVEDIDPNVTISDTAIGKSAVNYINRQARIMGGSLI